MLTLGVRFIQDWKITIMRYIRGRVTCFKYFTDHNFKVLRLRFLMGESLFALLLLLAKNCINYIQSEKHTMEITGKILLNFVFCCANPDYVNQKRLLREYYTS